MEAIRYRGPAAGRSRLEQVHASGHGRVDQRVAQVGHLIGQDVQQARCLGAHAEELFEQAAARRVDDHVGVVGRDFAVDARPFEGVVEVADLIDESDVEGVGVMVSVDRQERGQGERSALDELQDELGIPTGAIVTLDEIIEHLDGREVAGRVLVDDEMRGRIAAYRDQYGAR